MTRIAFWLTCMMTAVGSAPPLFAATVAHWRFEEGPAGAGVARGGLPDGVFHPAVADHSGNGHALSSWSDGGSEGHVYRADVPDGSLPGGEGNQLSVQNTGSNPQLFSDPDSSMQSMTPAAWSIEASFKPESGGYRTIVGRDSEGAHPQSPANAALYFQVVPGGAVAIKFVDVSGYWHVAQSADGLVDGFDWPDAASGHWYNMVAVCDGRVLSLYLEDVDAGGGLRLVARTDLTAGGSPDTRLTAGLGSGPGWTAGTWTVGRGLYDGNKLDWAYGLIDEVRISDEALAVDAFLFARPVRITDVGLSRAGGSDRVWIEWASRTGMHYRVTGADSPAEGTWLPEASSLPSTPPANVWTTGLGLAASGALRVEPDVGAVDLDLWPDVILNGIEENVYGHFLEHIYHSVNGGLWGDLVWNRSLEMWPSGALSWSLEGGDLVQSSLGTNVRLMFGDAGWTDYELTLEARKDGGEEGFLVLFRADGEDFYWANLGGWGNARHQLEKGNTGSGWGPVGPSVTGSIRTGLPWYQVRVRCEGHRLQVWLDGTELVDWTDNTGAHLSGRVGVGTWATQARFRDIVVKDLSGGTLWSGLPPLPEGAPPVDWAAFGPVDVDYATGAANSLACAALAKTGAEAGGLEQSPMRFDVQPYTGSFWAKGSGIDSIRVRMKDNTLVLAEAAFPAPVASWRKYPFVLTPSAPTLAGTLEVAFLGTGTAYLDQVSLMGQDALDTGGYRPDLFALTTNIAPPIIRWPGGCFASAYRWKDGIGPQDDRVAHPAVQWDDQDVNAYGTDEFLRMCERIGAQPILVINTGINAPCGISGSYTPPAPAEALQDAMDWIEYCNGDTNTPWGAMRAANGHPEPYNVTYWEIDNETWSMGSPWYIDRVNEYAPLMRAMDPSIKLIAVGSGWADQRWSRDIIDGCAANIDYLSVHSYLSPAEWASGPLAYEAYLVDLAGYIAGSANPNIKIYNSEWNAQSIDLRTGLFAGGLLNVFERQGADFHIGGPALMYRHLSASAWNNAFMNFDHTGSFAAPNYVVMKLWRDHYAPWRIDVRGDAGTLNLVATRSDDGSTVNVKVINPNAVPTTVNLNMPLGTGILDADVHHVTAPSLYTENSLAYPEAVRAVAGTAERRGSTVRVTLPPTSASVVSLGID
jgi:alpha-N-arabinofuranosidase